MPDYPCPQPQPADFCPDAGPALAPPGRARPTMHGPTDLAPEPDNPPPHDAIQLDENVSEYVKALWTLCRQEDQWRHHLEQEFRSLVQQVAERAHVAAADEQVDALLDQLPHHLQLAPARLQIDGVTASDVGGG